MAPPKKKRRPRPVTRQELVANNPSIADQIENRATKWKNRALIVAAIGAAVGVIVQGYLWIGLPALVTDRVLDKTIGNVKTEVNTKIDTTKNEVVQNQNAIKGEITGSISEITKTLNSVARSQSASAMDAADMAFKLAFTQLQSVQGQLATWKQVLAKDPNDPQAQMRVLQLETFVKQNEQDMKDAKDKIAKLRGQ